MTEKPIIFLDLDGVVNDHTQTESGFCGVKPECAARLNRILHATGAEIVISSAWRYMIPEAMSLQGFQYMLQTHGIDCRDRIVGLTCRDEELEPRGQQIRHWRNENGGGRRYVVIDDLDLGITEAGHPFVQTTGNVGLTDADVEAAILLLA